MTRPMILEFNAETREEVIREMNDVEYAQRLIDIETEASANAE